MNTPCLHHLSNTNAIPYQLRTSKLEQPLRRTSRYGLRTFYYVGSHLWIKCFKWLWWHCSYRFQLIQSILKYMERTGYFPICDTSPVMTSNAVSGFVFWCLSCIGYLYWYFVASLHAFFYLMIIYSTLYIFAPYNRILAFWLMLFVFHTILNDVYFILFRFYMVYLQPNILINLPLI